MIARVRILLPYRLHMPKGLSLSPESYERASGEMVTIFPPLRSTLSATDLDLESASPPLQVAMALEGTSEDASNVTFIDGAETMPCDLLQIEFSGRDFDRRQDKGSDISSGDPLVLAARADPSFEDILAIANHWLLRLRLVSRAGYLKPLDLSTTYMLLAYLNDAGKEFPRAAGLLRRIAWTPRKWFTVGIDSRVWAAIRDLGPTYQPLPAQVLLLDAFGILPDVGPAIVLANVALEIRIGEVLQDSVPSTGVGPRLWSWITDREKYWQNPSVRDEFDVLLQALTGRTLRAEAALWPAFSQLRDARNSFVHEGKATIRTGRKRVTVTAGMAEQLLAQAQEILDWLDELPYLTNRSVKTMFPTEFQHRMPLAALPIGTIAADSDA